MGRFIPLKGVYSSTFLKLPAGISNVPKLTLKQRLGGNLLNASLMIFRISESGKAYRRANDCLVF